MKIISWMAFTLTDRQILLWKIDKINKIETYNINSTVFRLMMFIMCDHHHLEVIYMISNVSCQDGEHWQGDKAVGGLLLQRESQAAQEVGVSALRPAHGCSRRGVCPDQTGQPPRRGGAAHHEEISQHPGNHTVTLSAGGQIEPRLAAVCGDTGEAGVAEIASDIDIWDIDITIMLNMYFKLYILTLHQNWWLKQISLIKTFTHRAFVLM